MPNRDLPGVIRDARARLLPREPLV